MNDRIQLELWGYPGSGKSTLAAMLRERWGMKAPPERRWRRAAGIKTILSHPLQYCALSFSSCGDHSTRSNLVGLKRRMLFAYHGIVQSCYRHKVGSKVVLDEAMTHLLWRYVYNNPEQVHETWWRRYLHFSGPVVVVLDVSKETAIGRIAGKKRRCGPINRELLASELNGAKWIHAEACYKSVLDGLRDVHGDQLVELDNNGDDPLATCEALFEEVASMMDGRACENAVRDDG